MCARLDAEILPTFPILIPTSGGGGVVCSWTGGAGSCRGRLHLPTRDVLSRHNNRLARDKGAGTGRRTGPGGTRGGEGAARVGAGAETSCPASGLGPAFDPRFPRGPPAGLAPATAAPASTRPFQPHAPSGAQHPGAGGMAVSWSSWLANEGVKHLCLVGWRARLAWRSVCLAASLIHSWSVHGWDERSGSLGRGEGRVVSDFFT